MISPDQIKEKSRQLYNRYLRFWIRDEADDFFPLRLRANLETPKGDLPKAQADVDRLRNESKSSRGSGYRVEWKRKRSRDLGSNEFPEAIWIDSRDDLLSLCDAAEHFRQTEKVVADLRSRFPDMEDWIRRHRTQIAELAPKLDDLIAVAEYFVAHPWPDCFVRELPLPVDTKFVERNKGILRQWLDVLLSDAEMDVNETKFPRRFGLRDDIQHHTLHLLDDSLRAELNLPFKELSLTAGDMASLPVRGCNVLIVENRTNLLTLPPIKGGLAIGGEGTAVTRFRRFPWLALCKIYYWGDLDAAGLQILSQARSHLGLDVTSLMMDIETLNELAHLIESHPTVRKSTPENLDPAEMAAYERCCRDQIWIEQERIPQSFVLNYLSTVG